MDEAHEVLTLMNTGKSAIVPMMLVEAGPKPYWRIWDRWAQGTLVERGLIDPTDAQLYRIVDTVEDAVREILGFYRVFHSARIVGGNLVYRLQRPLGAEQLKEVQRRFEDILKGPVDQAAGPVPQELNEFPDLARLVLPFNRTSYARLRLLIDFLNTL
ncbi:MAG: LOG family protein [Candidatus Rokubacteria bacterium]|nr:LOG family protein [Candidatus Rokubacteria bacterium]